MALNDLQIYTRCPDELVLRELGNEKKGEYSCTSKNMGVVKMGEDVDDQFGRKVLDGGVHIWGVGLGDEIRGRVWTVVASRQWRMGVCPLGPATEKLQRK